MVRSVRHGTVIPDNILTRAPTAELRENQTDQDTLPPYDVLDGILERLVEREEPIAKIVADGFDRETVMKVERMLNLAEYKRRQAAPGVKVTLKNFGRDRRYPIVNRFRDSGAPLPEPDRSLLKDAPARSEAFDFVNRSNPVTASQERKQCTKRQRVSRCQPPSSARCRGRPGTTRCSGSKSFLEAMVNSRYREQYEDAVSCFLRAQEIAGLDICTDGDAHYDEEVGGMSWQGYPLTHMDGFAEQVGADGLQDRRRRLSARAYPARLPRSAGVPAHRRAGGTRAAAVHGDVEGGAAHDQEAGQVRDHPARADRGVGGGRLLQGPGRAHLGDQRRAQRGA